MIVEALFGLFMGVVDWVLGLLPDIAPPDLSGMATSLGEMIGPYGGWLDKYLPLSEARTALGVLLGAWLLMHGIRLTVWVLTKAHVLGGGSE